MSFATAQLPLAVRAFNSAFAALGGVGEKLVPLQPGPLLRKASGQTGLADFGPDYFREPLQRLCTSLNEDARLTGLGRVMAQRELLRLLRNRLQFVDIFKRHPEIAEQEITAPIFILGMPRTGTTSLHELMALDPQFRVPLSWEVAHPFPPPRRETYQYDPRIAAVDAELARIDRLLPDFKNMHPMGARLPQECVALFAYDFASMIFDVQFRLKQYQDWLIGEDMTAVFVNHRRWLQLLQWHCPANTWVLKSPQYLWNIDDMLKAHPEARVIQTHRDPVKVSTSIASLSATLRSLASDRVELTEVAQEYADLLHYGTGKTMTAREQGLLPPGRVLDVQFGEFRRDPVATLRRAYACFGLQLTDSTAAAMQQFLDAGRGSERHGRHQYRFEDMGLDLQAERARFAPYQALYNVPSEPL